MTSNLGAQPLLAALSDHTTIKDARENVMEEVCACIFLVHLFHIIILKLAAVL